LASQSKADFIYTMDVWTKKARGAPFVDHLFHLDTTTTTTTTTANSNADNEK
jgi:hypothetical protein